MFNPIEIEKLVSGLLVTIDTVNKTLDNANNLITIPGVYDAVDDLQISMKNFKSIMKKLDESNMQEAINAGHLALDSLTETLDKTNSMLEPNSPIQYNVIKMTSELEETARSIRSLIEILERNPQALIFGKDNEAKGE